MAIMQFPNVSIGERGPGLRRDSGHPVGAAGSDLGHDIGGDPDEEQGYFSCPDAAHYEFCGTVWPTSYVDTTIARAGPLERLRL